MRQIQRAPAMPIELLSFDRLDHPLSWEQWSRRDGPYVLFIQMWESHSGMSGGLAGRSALRIWRPAPVGSWGSTRMNRCGVSSCREDAASRGLGRVPGQGVTETRATWLNPVGLKAIACARPHSACCVSHR